jgi:hypothetical protein
MPWRDSSSHIGLPQPPSHKRIQELSKAAHEARKATSHIIDKPLGMTKLIIVIVAVSAGYRLVVNLEADR